MWLAMLVRLLKISSRSNSEMQNGAKHVLVVDDFGVKYVGKQHVLHLLNALKMFYEKISVDWTGKLFCGITLNWNYQQKYVDLSMPGYIKNVLHKYSRLH